MEELAEVYADKVVKLHGVLLFMLSDMGMEFT